MIMMKYVGLALTLIVSTLADNREPSVNTPLGSIEGFWQVSRGGRQFQAYEGIPYALPPVGERRFEPPQPVAPWEGTLQAKFSPSKCLQYALESTDTENIVSGAEDCLYLNVYTPIQQVYKRNHTTLLPVIIYIHGGAFQMLSGTDHQPHFLMDKDVVFVSLNYRLGPLGFLSTEDGVVPGNMGLKDQNLAMKWVSKNIESFGGDPGSVTLTGLSAGSASVHLHYLSPMSRGLFHRGISVSGTALDCWTQTESSLEKAKKLAALMECPTHSSEELIRCLKSRPAQSILKFEGKFLGWRFNPFTPFGPVVERQSATPFIDKSPIEIISSGEMADLPWITSTVTEEGLYPAADFVLKEKLMNELDEHWEQIAPHLLDYNYTIPSSEHARVAQDIRSHYMGDKRIELENAHDLIGMISDRLFIADAGKAAKKQAKVNENPVWFYYFSYRGEHSLSDALSGTTQNIGVSHADDIFYVLANATGPFHTEQDIQMSLDMVNMWYSFATTGIPNMSIEWPRVNRYSEELNYLRISKPGQLSIENDDNFGQKKFWDSVNFNENK